MTANPRQPARDKRGKLHPLIWDQRHNRYQCRQCGSILEPGEITAIRFGHCAPTTTRRETP